MPPLVVIPEKSNAYLVPDFLTIEYQVFILISIRIAGRLLHACGTPLSESVHSLVTGPSNSTGRAGTKKILNFEINGYLCPIDFEYEEPPYHTCPSSCEHRGALQVRMVWINT